MPFGSAGRLHPNNSALAGFFVHTLKARGYHREFPSWTWQLRLKAESWTPCTKPSTRDLLLESLGKASSTTELSSARKATCWLWGQLWPAERPVRAALLCRAGCAPRQQGASSWRSTAALRWRWWIPATAFLTTKCKKTSQIAQAWRWGMGLANRLSVGNKKWLIWILAPEQFTAHRQLLKSTLQK